MLHLNSRLMATEDIDMMFTNQLKGPVQKGHGSTLTDFQGNKKKTCLRIQIKLYLFLFFTACTINQGFSLCHTVIFNC
jgi:hypothetical protein